MRLDELRHTISDSEPDDWNVITGPSYLDHFVPMEVNRGQPGLVYELHHAAHHTRAILTSDVDISIAWGLYLDPDNPAYFSEAWTQSFPDKKAYAQYADVFYRGSLVDRVTIVAVDGGRYKIAMPEQDLEEIENMKPKLIGYWIGPWEDAVGRLITRLDGGHSYEAGLKRAGIEYRP